MDVFETQTGLLLAIEAMDVSETQTDLLILAIAAMAVSETNRITNGDRGYGHKPDYPR